MYKIGITGSIGAGKTSIANIFAFLNMPVFDADKEVKKILSKKKKRHCRLCFKGANETPAYMQCNEERRRKSDFRTRIHIKYNYENIIIDCVL